MAALQYLDSLRNAHPELNEWYNTLSDLYQKKLWHQLTLKLEQFVTLAVFQVPKHLLACKLSFIYTNCCYFFRINFMISPFVLFDLVYVFLDIMKS